VTEAGAPPPPAAPRWAGLRRFTGARVALGRAGNALPTAAQLDLQEAQARARDAVWSALDPDALEAAVAPLGLPVLRAASEAPDRRTYLLRPDLGRRLRAEDRARLAAASAAPGGLAFVVADGLSASGVQAGAPALLAEAVPRLAAAGVPLGPVVVATQGRVALGDAIGEALGAAMVAVLIGERPGLSAPESMGVYLTLDPRPGRTDAERNCLSNIRPGGLGAREAAETLAWLVGAARRLGATGVALKDERPQAPPPLPPSPA
jgi:ethanolamine ammonia-lyase small subunit